METKNIYGIKTTIFDENSEVSMTYMNIGFFTSLKKAYEDMKQTAILFEATIYEENTPYMHIHYTNKQGERVMETIVRYLLY